MIDYIGAQQRIGNFDDEGVFKFLFKKLKSQNSDFSKELLAALQRRFNERRNKDVMTLMAYLQTGKIPLGDDDFTYCSKTAMMSFTKKFVSHNFAAQLQHKTWTYLQRLKTRSRKTWQQNCKNRYETFSLASP
jgi:hypothetical protein